MAKKIMHTVRLGVFVMAGLAFLVLLLYVIGKNQNLFGNTFVLKARFSNIHGLMPGNNIRFAGIDAGTVKGIEVVNDTTIEVTLLVKEKMRKYIHKNARVSISTDGLMGNKLLNIEPEKARAPLVEEGDMLLSAPGVDTDEMLKVLSATNADIAVIAKDLKETVQRLNSSKAVWTILNDESLPVNLRRSLLGAKNAADHMEHMMISLEGIVERVNSGQGSMGELLADTTIADNVKEAFVRIRNVGIAADTLTLQINKLVENVSYEVNSGKGSINALLKDEKMADNINKTLENIEQGTRAFNENMEAIKHNFLFRGYFKKQEKKKTKM